MSGRERPVVLVADDDDDIVALVTIRLERAGYDVLPARDGRQALMLALEQVPDLTVLDISMPALDGLEVTRLLRADERTRSMPVVLLTARAQSGDAARGREAGADAYISKPFDPVELRNRVHELLSRR